jgi:hypothetical protein
MIVFPSCVKEYSTAMAFALVTRLAINPVDSRLRSRINSSRMDASEPSGLNSYRGPVWPFRIC